PFWVALPGVGGEFVEHLLLGVKLLRGDAGVMLLFELLEPDGLATGLAEGGCRGIRIRAQPLLERREVRERAAQRGAPGRHRIEGHRAGHIGRGATGGAARAFLAHGVLLEPPAGLRERVARELLLQAAQAQQAGERESLAHRSTPMPSTRRVSWRHDSSEVQRSSMRCCRKALMAVSWSAAASTSGLLRRW